MSKVSALLALMVLLPVTPALGQANPDLAGRLKDVAPFIDDQVTVVVHADLAALDLNGIDAWIGDMVRAVETDPKELGAANLQLRMVMFMVKGLQAEFRKAGGRDVYVLVTASPDDLPAVVMPMAQGANTAAVTGMLTKLVNPSTRPAGGGADMRIEIVGGAIVVASSDVTAQLKRVKPVARPELAEALRAAGDSVAQLVFVPTTAIRQQLQALLSQVPPELGGGPGANLANSVKWVVLAVNTPPQRSVKLVVQAAAAKDAQVLDGLAARLLALAAAAAPAPQVWPLLKPRLAGERLTVSLDNPQVKKLEADLLIPGLRQARWQGRRAQSMSNLRQIAVACIMHRDDHKGQWPDNLDALAPYLKSDGPLTNPLEPDRKPGYVYARPRDKAVANPARVILVYEAHTQWPEGGLAVGLADGHVELMQDEIVFKQRLASQQQ
jgi:hypothetical protein